jgi:hypothetical protein
MLTRIMLIVVVAFLVTGVLEIWFWRNRVAAADGTNGEGHRSQRRSSLLTESLTCAGVILIFSGSGVAISQRWLQVTDWERTAILAAAAACFLIAGAIVRWVSGSVWPGLTEALWIVSAACAGAVTAILAVRIYGISGAAATLAVGAVIAVYSATLWLMCRRELLLIAALAGLVSALCGTIMVISRDTALWLTIALGLWLLGLAWAALGWVYPEPLGTSICLGAAVALASPAIAVHDHGWVYAIGIATAAAVMAASVPLRNVILLAFGSCALFGYITSAVITFSHGSLGIAETLIFVGVLLIGMALLTVQLGRVTHPLRSIPDMPDERPSGQLPHHQNSSDMNDQAHGDTAHAPRTRDEHARAA